VNGIHEVGGSIPPGSTKFLLRPKQKEAGQGLPAGFLEVLGADPDQALIADPDPAGGRETPARADAIGPPPSVPIAPIAVVPAAVMPTTATMTMPIAVARMSVPTMAVSAMAMPSMSAMTMTAVPTTMTMTAAMAVAAAMTTMAAVTGEGFRRQHQCANDS
jgi:hypothetical protein